MKQIVSRQVALAGQVVDGATGEPVPGARVDLATVPVKFQRVLDVQRLSRGKRVGQSRRARRSEANEQRRQLLLPRPAERLVRLDRLARAGGHRYAPRQGNGRRQAQPGWPHHSRLGRARATGDDRGRHGVRPRFEADRVRVSARKGEPERAYTDKVGHFSLTGLEPGRRSIVVAARGFVPSPIRSPSQSPARRKPSASASSRPPPNTDDRYETARRSPTAGHSSNAISETEKRKGGRGMPQYLSPGVYVEEVAIVGPADRRGRNQHGRVRRNRTRSGHGSSAGTRRSIRRSRSQPPTRPLSATHSRFRPPPASVRLCTTFSDFTKAFGGFSTDAGQSNLAHAVFGFFNNGGTRCYVSRVAAAGDIETALDRVRGDRRDRDRRRARDRHQRRAHARSSTTARRAATGSPSSTRPRWSRQTARST